VLEWALATLGCSHVDLEAAAHVELALDDPTFVPLLNAERYPIVTKPGRQRWYSERDLGTVPKIRLLAAVLEGIAFNIVGGLESLESGTPSHVLLAGGVTRSLAWCQSLSDLLGRPVEVLARADLSVLGAARLAATAIATSGTAPTDGAWNVRDGSARLRPRAEREGLWQRRRRRYSWHLLGDR
jgi:sugar (pentulose or hexulose) kinase